MARKRTPAEAETFEHARWDGALAGLASARAELATVAADPDATDEERAIAADVFAALLSARLVLRPGGLPAARLLKHGASRARSDLGFGEPNTATHADGVRALEAWCEKQISKPATLQPKRAAGTTPSDLASALAVRLGPTVDLERLVRALEAFAAVAVPMRGRIHTPPSTEHSTGSRRDRAAQCMCAKCTAARIVARAIKLAG